MAQTNHKILWNTRNYIYIKKLNTSQIPGEKAHWMTDIVDASKFGLLN